MTNNGLIQVAERQHEKITRVRDHYDEAKVMNQEMLEERAQQAASKAKERSDKKGISHMNRVMKAFMRLDSIIFTDSKKRSPKKKVNNGLSSENLALRPSSFIQPSFIESLLPVTSVSLRQQRKRASKPIKASKEQSLTPSQSTRSGRLIRSRNLNL